jgi:antitoxin (DNA-binding transcriptional repressor) of toxin-antitoxin stability system
MQTERIGVREFRENLSGYLESPTPVAITRHGETIGFYVPTRRRPDEADLEALQRAGERLSALIAASGASEDELVDEFKTLRKKPPVGR